MERRLYGSEEIPSSATTTSTSTLNIHFSDPQFQLIARRINLYCKRLGLHAKEWFRDYDKHLTGEVTMSQVTSPPFSH